MLKLFIFHNTRKNKHLCAVTYIMRRPRWPVSFEGHSIKLHVQLEVWFRKTKPTTKHSHTKLYCTIISVVLAVCHWFWHIISQQNFRSKMGTTWYICVYIYKYMIFCCGSTFCKACYTSKLFIENSEIMCLQLCVIPDNICHLSSRGRMFSNWLQIEFLKFRITSPGKQVLTFEVPPICQVI